MKSISLKLDDPIYLEAEEILNSLKKSRNRYINEAVEHYNKLHKRKKLEEQLSKESDLVSKESMKVLKEFEDIDHAD